MKSKIHKPFSVSPWLASKPIHSNWLKKTLLVFFFFVFVVMSCVGQNQGVNNVWLLGYESSSSYPWGNTRFDFNSGNLMMAYDSLPMSFAVSHTNISDTAGNLLFYTNGIYIADATNDTMQNGSGLNPSVYTGWYLNDGLFIPQAELILPKPDSPGIYCMFHSTIDNTVDYYANYLYLTTINMSLNNGKGAVVSKNQIIFSDTLNGGRIIGCRHGNGRDWWVFCHRAYSNIFCSFLITPYGINGPYQQAIGIIRPPDYGQCVFSPDGTRLAYYTTSEDLEVFDFDRCSGLLSNPRYVAINDSALDGGCAFSSNSKVLYLSSVRYIYQFDVTAPNLAASLDTVAVYDGFLAPLPGFPSVATYFRLSALAPDGKIYVTTGNGTLFMHVINSPDSLGAACDVKQHTIQLPSLYFNTLPNHPNYFLGRDTGSVCDTVTVWQGLTPDPSPKEMVVKALPNPNDGVFTLWFPLNNDVGWLEIYDVDGRLVLKEGVAQWSQYKQVDLKASPSVRFGGAGIYFCRMIWGNVVQTVKVIKN